MVTHFAIIIPCMITCELELFRTLQETDMTESTTYCYILYFQDFASTLLLRL